MFSDFFTNYASYEYALASSQLFLAMLGMGALLAPSDFLLELKTPRALALGIGCQWLLAPVVAVLLASVLPIPVGVAAGLMLVAAVPGGTLSNILTHFGAGNIALSISLTAITTVAALVTTPLLLDLMLGQYLPADFEMPMSRILREIVITLLFPLALGMGLKTQLAAQHSEVFSRWAIRLSLGLVVLMAIGAGGSGRLDPQAYGIMGIVALVVLGFGLQISALLVSRLAGLSTKDRLAIVVEVSFRNMSLAVAIKALAFPAQSGVADPLGDAIFFTVLLYAGVSLFLSLIPVLGHRFAAKRTAFSGLANEIGGN